MTGTGRTSLSRQQDNLLPHTVKDVRDGRSQMSLILNKFWPSGETKTDEYNKTKQTRRLTRSFYNGG